MINYDSILSAFDGKPTLLQWLKMVKKALDESVLKNVDITQNGEKVVFTFNFEDGTNISTPEVTLPKGDKGDKGENGISVVSFTFDSYQVLANNTETTYKMTLSNGTETNFAIYAKNGVRITGIDTVSDQVVGNETLTTLRANYSDETSSEFIVKAKNGTSSGSKIYNHFVALRSEGYSYYMYFNIYSNKENLTLDDVLAQIPTSQGEPGNIFNKPKISVCFNFGDYFGVIPITKYASGSGNTFEDSGILTNRTSVQSKKFTFNSLFLENDTILG